MNNYRYDFELHTLNEIPTNDARLFLDIIINKALLQIQAIQYKDNTEIGRAIQKVNKNLIIYI